MPSDYSQFEGRSLPRPRAAARPAVPGQAPEAAPPNRPARSVMRHFRPGGRFALVRGVLLEGEARFVLEPGQGEVPLEPSAVTLDVGDSGEVALVHEGVRFGFDTHARLACPLARFTERKGEILYTLAPRDRIGELKGTGLVRGRDLGEVAHLLLSPVEYLLYSAASGEERAQIIRSLPLAEWYASEFSGTWFPPLLALMDLTRATKEVPKNVAEELIGRPLAEPFRDFTDLSYLNSDAGMVYKVFLSSRSRSVDVSGVPARYQWLSRRDGTPHITAVHIYRDDFSPAARLTDFGKPGAKPTHYDVVVFFQTAGVFRQMHLQDPKAFAAFRAKACRAAAPGRSAPSGTSTPGNAALVSS